MFFLEKDRSSGVEAVALSVVRKVVPDGLLGSCSCGREIANCWQSQDAEYMGFQLKGIDTGQVRLSLKRHSARNIGLATIWNNIEYGGDTA